MYVAPKAGEHPIFVSGAPKIVFSVAIRNKAEAQNPTPPPTIKLVRIRYNTRFEWNLLVNPSMRAIYGLSSVENTQSVPNLVENVNINI